MAKSGVNEDLLRTKKAEKVHGKEPMKAAFGTTWKVVNSKVNFTEEGHPRFVSLSAAIGRERLFLDTNSAIFLDLKQKARALSKGQNIATILTKINSLVNNLNAQPGKTLAEIDTEIDEKLDRFLEKRIADLPPHNELDVHMDELITKKLLVCRHTALIVAALLGDLVKQGILPNGVVRQYRSGLKSTTSDHPKGAHTWAVYRNFNTGHLWHIDPRWQLACNVNIYKDRLATVGYGDETIALMIDRLHKLDCHYDFTNFLNQHAKGSFSESLTGAKIIEETFLKPYRHIYLELKPDAASMAAFTFALDKQKVSYEIEYHHAYFLTIKCDDSSNVFNFDFDKFTMDYNNARRRQTAAQKKQPSSIEEAYWNSLNSKERICLLESKYSPRAINELKDSKFNELPFDVIRFISEKIKEKQNSPADPERYWLSLDLKERIHLLEEKYSPAAVEELKNANFNDLPTGFIKLFTEKIKAHDKEKENEKESYHKHSKFH